MATSVGHLVKGAAKPDFVRGPGNQLASEIKNAGKKRARGFPESGGMQPAAEGFREAVKGLSLPSSVASDAAKRGPGFPVINRKVPEMKKVFPGDQPFAAMTAEFSRPHPLKGLEMVTQNYYTRKTDYQSYGVREPLDLLNLLTTVSPIFVVAPDSKDVDRNGDVLKFWNLGMVNRELGMNPARFLTRDQAAGKFKYIGYAMDVRVSVDQPNMYMVTIISGGYHKVADIWGESAMRGHKNMLRLVRRTKGYEQRQAQSMNDPSKGLELDMEIEVASREALSLYEEPPVNYWKFEPFVYCSENPPSYEYCSAEWDGMLVSIGIDFDSAPTDIRSQLDHADKLTSYGKDDSAEKRGQLARTCKKVTVALCSVVNR